MAQFKKLFEPVKIGQMEVKNRLEAAPTLCVLAQADGYGTTELVKYYQAKAKGGVGIVTVGESAIDSDYAPTHAGQLHIGSDLVIPKLGEIAEAIKRYGAKASLELCHGGRQTIPSMIGGRKPIGPSPMSSRFHEILAGHKIYVEEMTQEQIEQVKENYASAAARLKRAGFDMALIHGGHGWLLAQFLSPLSNRRTDNYGGSLENRARFPIEVLEKIRERVGPEFALEYRFSVTELVPGGLTPEEGVEFAKMIEDKVDCLQCSVGMISSPQTFPYTHPPTYLPRGVNVKYAEKVKKAVKIPVTALGAIHDLAQAEKIIAEGKADMVAMARALIADPGMPNKIVRGKAKEVVPCIRCNECLGKAAVFLPLRCAVNPVTGREFEYGYIRPADEKKRVVVAGGGPAGMEAAIVAASRGHEVTLFEKSEKLGGNLFVASRPPFKDEMKNFLEYLINKVNSLPVDIKLSTEATAKTVKAAKPDVLIVAVGAEPLVPDIPGITKPIVAGAIDVLLGQAKVGKKVAVAGGGLVGCELALYLTQQGKKVTVIEMLDDVATDLNMVNRTLLMEMLGKAKVDIQTGTKIEEVLDDGVKVIDKEWQEKKVTADTVVTSLGFRPRAKTVKALKDLAPEVYVIGDCSAPRKIFEAMHEAFNIAVEI